MKEWYHSDTDEVNGLILLIFSYDFAFGVCVDNDVFTLGLTPDIPSLWSNDILSILHLHGGNKIMSHSFMTLNQ